MDKFNDIGIDDKLDWNRIEKLMRIGIFAACMVLVGDVLIGYGMHDSSKTGMEWFLSAYLQLSDTRMFWSAFLGFIGIPLEALCYFGVYRLIVPKSQKYAHLYRTGILGVLAFAGCGVHVPCLSTCFFYKYMNDVAPEIAVDAAEKIVAKGAEKQMGILGVEIVLQQNVLRLAAKNILMILKQS